MTLTQYYSQPQKLITAVGNNSFSFDTRKTQGSRCELTIPDIVSVSLDEGIPLGNIINIGNDIVFEEIDHHGKLQTCIGLEHIYEIKKEDNTPIYIMDNHNHALYLRIRAYQQKRLGAGASLIHIDQHADMGIPEVAIDNSKCSISSNSFGKEGLDYVAWYTNEVCNVGSFIVPAQEIGLINEIIQVRTVSKLMETAKESNKVGKNSIILDIDCDFFVDHDPSSEELQAIKALYQQSALCTIALSPYFMDIQKAKKIALQIAEVTGGSAPQSNT